jgi:hypothetical protein
MRRRTALHVLSVAAAGRPQLGARALAEATPDPLDDAALRAVAEVVLPTELGAAGTAGVVAAFRAWLRSYAAGAELDHGYGFPELRYAAKAPDAGYGRQLAALRASSTQADFTQLGVPERRALVELLAFFFRSAEASDLCYRSQIGREGCLGLPGSEEEPAPLGGQGEPT